MDPQSLLPPDEAELAALADGSLSPDRRAELEARVEASPELAERLAEQRRAIALAQRAAADVEAPPALRARVDARRHAPGAPARRLVVIGAIGFAVVAVALGLTFFR